MGGVGWDSGFDSCYRVGLWSGGYEVLDWGHWGWLMRFLVTLG